MDEAKTASQGEHKYVQREGYIVKGIGGFYYVACHAESNAAGENEEETVVECRARGRFRQKDVSPLPGDHVGILVLPGEKTGGYVTEIHPRKNQLHRPPVANVDQLVLVLSAAQPPPDLMLVDKLLVQADIQSVAPLILLNKIDVADADTRARVRADYSHLPLCFLEVSAYDSSGLEKLKGALRGKLSCFAGQSAVGKSSLLNAISRHFDFETGSLSKKTGRGRHTTRAVELARLRGEQNSFVMDTPGFSMLDIGALPPEDLQLHYPEMMDMRSSCRFDDCLHENEPDCAVKAAVKEGGIPEGRYRRYLLLLEELKEKEERKYK